MAEKPPSLTVSDRRKFTLEGDLRDNTASPAEAPAAAKPAPPESAPATDSKPGPRLVTTPPAATDELSAHEDPAVLEQEEALPEPTAQESAEQHEAYKQS